MSITDYETWWMKSGNFNMDLFINYLRAKNEKLQSDIQGQRWQMDEDGQNLLFNFRIRDPEFAMGRNAQHACENYERDVYEEDEIVFTGYWQHV